MKILIGHLLIVFVISITFFPFGSPVYGNSSDNPNGINDFESLEENLNKRVDEEFQNIYQQKNLHKGFDWWFNVAKNNNHIIQGTGYLIVSFANQNMEYVYG